MLTSAVAAIFVVATELSISWNHITGVQDLSSAGQLIPFFLGLVIFIHVPWTYYKERKKRRAAEAEIERQRPPGADPRARFKRVKKYDVTDPHSYQQQQPMELPPQPFQPPSPTSSYTIANSFSMPSPQYQASPPPRRPNSNSPYTIANNLAVPSPQYQAAPPRRPGLNSSYTIANSYSTPSPLVQASPPRSLAGVLT